MNSQSVLYIVETGFIMLHSFIHICSLIYISICCSFSFVCVCEPFSKSIIYLHYPLVFFLVAALSGNFVNFGIFELYGDRALVDALDITVKLILSIPLADIFAFRKVLLYLYAMFSNVLVNCKCFNDYFVCLFS